jgi:glycosyltransferase involved in cell wall biosynthesis
VKKVLFWMAGYDGCGYYRMQLPADNLPKDRWDPTVSTNSGSDWPRFDVIVGQRIYMNEEAMSPVLNWVNMARDLGTRTVYELDDNFFAMQEDNPAYEVFSDEAVLNNVRACASMADLVTVSTEPLREVMLDFNPNVNVVPNFIDESWLRVERIRNKWPIIGWAGSATHSNDWKVVGDAVGEAMLMHQESLAFIMGGQKHYAGSVPQNRLKWTPWVRNPAKVCNWTREFDIGLAPLASNPFNESKSRIKVLEYAALGIPVIASDVLPYREFVDHGITGFLANSPKEWREHLLYLLKNPIIREEMGMAAKEKAAQFTIQANIGLWDQALSM